MKKTRAQKTMSNSMNQLSDFSASQEVMGEDAKTGFAFDERRGKICLISKMGRDVDTTILNCSDLLSVELFEDGKSITKTMRGSQIGGALIGGLVFGPLGAIVGGLSGKRKSVDRVKRLDLRMVVNNTSKPTHDVNFLDIEVKKSSLTYKASLDSAKKWSAIIETLIKRADDNDAETEQADSDAGSTPDLPVILRELARLRDEGILSEDEFAEQKAKLLR